MYEINQIKVKEKNGVEKIEKIEFEEHKGMKKIGVRLDTVYPINEVDKKIYEEKFYRKKKKMIRIFGGDTKEFDVCLLPLCINLSKLDCLEEITIDFRNLGYKTAYMYQDWIYKNVKIMYSTYLGENVRSLYLSNCLFEFNDSFVFANLNKITLIKVEIVELKMLNDENFPKISYIYLEEVIGSEKHEKRICMEKLSNLDILRISKCQFNLEINLVGDKLTRFFADNYVDDNYGENYMMDDVKITLNIQSVQKIKIFHYVSVKANQQRWLSLLKSTQIENFALSVVDLGSFSGGIEKWKYLKEVRLVECRIRSISGFLNLETLFITKLYDRITIKEMPNLKFIVVIHGFERFQGEDNDIFIQDLPKLEIINMGRFNSYLYLSNLPVLNNIIMNSDLINIIFKTGVPCLTSIVSNNGYLDFQKPEDMKELKEIKLSHFCHNNFAKNSNIIYSLLPVLETITLKDDEHDDYFEYSPKSFDLMNCKSLKKAVIKNVDVKLKFLPKLQDLNISSKSIIKIENFEALKVLNVVYQKNQHVNCIQNLPSLTDLSMEFIVQDDGRDQFSKVMEVGNEFLNKVPVFISHLKMLKSIKVFKTVTGYYLDKVKFEEKLKPLKVLFNIGYLENDINVVYYLTKRQGGCILADIVLASNVNTDEEQKDVKHLIKNTKQKFQKRKKLMMGKNLIALSFDTFGEIIYYVNSQDEFISLYSTCKQFMDFMNNKNYFCKNIIFKLFNKLCIPKTNLSYVLNLKVMKTDIQNQELNSFLKRFINLQVLDVRDCKMLTNDIFKDIQHLNKIVSFDIACGGLFGEDTFKHLSGLECLKIDHTGLFKCGKTVSLSDKSCGYITKLKMLHISFVRITHESLRKLVLVEDLVFWRYIRDLQLNADDLKL